MRFYYRIRSAEKESQKRKLSENVIPNQSDLNSSAPSIGLPFSFTLHSSASAKRNQRQSSSNNHPNNNSAALNHQSMSSSDHLNYDQTEQDTMSVPAPPQEPVAKTKKGKVKKKKGKKKKKAAAEKAAAAAAAAMMGSASYPSTSSSSSGVSSVCDAPPPAKKAKKEKVSVESGFKEQPSSGEVMIKTKKEKKNHKKHKSKHHDSERRKSTDLDSVNDHPSSSASHQKSSSVVPHLRIPPTATFTASQISPTAVKVVISPPKDSLNYKSPPHDPKHHHHHYHHKASSSSVSDHEKKQQKLQNDVKELQQTLHLINSKDMNRRQQNHKTSTSNVVSNIVKGDHHQQQQSNSVSKQQSGTPSADSRQGVHQDLKERKLQQQQQSESAVRGNEGRKIPASENKSAAATTIPPSSHNERSQVSSKSLSSAASVESKSTPSINPRTSCAGPASVSSILKSSNSSHHVNSGKITSVNNGMQQKECLGSRSRSPASALASATGDLSQPSPPSRPSPPAATNFWILQQKEKLKPNHSSSSSSSKDKNSSSASSSTSDPQKRGIQLLQDKKSDLLHHPLSHHHHHQQHQQTMVKSASNNKSESSFYKGMNLVPQSSSSSVQHEKLNGKINSSPSSSHSDAPRAKPKAPWANHLPPIRMDMPVNESKMTPSMARSSPKPPNPLIMKEKATSNKNRPSTPIQLGLKRSAASSSATNLMKGPASSTKFNINSSLQNLHSANHAAKSIPSSKLSSELQPQNTTGSMNSSLHNLQSIIPTVSSQQEKQQPSKSPPQHAPHHQSVHHSNHNSHHLYHQSPKSDAERSPNSSSHSPSYSHPKSPKSPYSNSPSPGKSPKFKCAALSPTSVTIVRESSPPSSAGTSIHGNNSLNNLPSPILKVPRPSSSSSSSSSGVASASQLSPSLPSSLSSSSSVPLNIPGSQFSLANFPLSHASNLAFPFLTPPPLAVTTSNSSSLSPSISSRPHTTSSSSRPHIPVSPLSGGPHHVPCRPVPTRPGSGSSFAFPGQNRTAWPGMLPPPVRPLDLTVRLGHPDIAVTSSQKA